MKDGFDVSQLTDFGQQILEVATQDMPKVTEKFMKSEANKLKNKAKRDARKVLKPHKKKTFKVIKDGKEEEVKAKGYVDRIKDGKKVYGYGDAKYNVMVYNSAPHAHLIEEGHNMVTHNGKKVGFVPGKHILENAAIDFEKQFAKHIENNLAKAVIKEMEK